VCVCVLGASISFETLFARKMRLFERAVKLYFIQNVFSIVS